MRFSTYALSAVLLSGCSWLGGSTGFGGQSHYGSYGQGGYGSYGGNNGCQVLAPQQPVPAGCAPSAVTLGMSQTPNFAQGYGQSGQYGAMTTAGYGSHVNVAGAQASQLSVAEELRKPRWRATFALGGEQSISGQALDYNDFGTLDPSVAYNPALYNETSIVGSQSGGNVTTTIYSAEVEEIIKPNISFDDLYSNPLHMTAGVEYISSPQWTLFANGGYTSAKAQNIAGASVIASIAQTVNSQDYVESETVPGTYIADGALVSNKTTLPNQNIANFIYEASNLKRLDLEVGTRRYFNPIVTDQGFKTLTPYIGAAVGASHYNDLTLDVSHQQAYYKAGYDGGGKTSSYFNVPSASSEPVKLYDAQWVFNGALTTGMEWQVSPRTAMALETGLKFESAREYSNGSGGDTQLSIPLRVRGSYNF